MNIVSTDEPESGLLNVRGRYNISTPDGQTVGDGRGRGEGLRDIPVLGRPVAFPDTVRVRLESFRRAS